MKFYIASRFFNKEQALQVMEVLKKRGHTVTADWTLHKDVRPYGEHPAEAQAYSNEDMQGVLDSDVFALLTGGGTDGKGMHVELGAAIALRLLHGKPHIFVVGKNNADSLFYFHPMVTRLDSVDDLLKEVGQPISLSLPRGERR